MIVKGIVNRSMGPGVHWNENSKATVMVGILNQLQVQLKQLPNAYQSQESLANS